MSVALAPGKQSLSELRDLANSEHRLVVTAASEMIAHAIEAGHALNHVRDLIPYGEWMPWVEREFEGSISNANLYRRLAINAEHITKSGARTLREANRWLTENAEIATPTPRTGTLVQHKREEILRLRKTGLGTDEVAALAGVSRSTVYNLSRGDWKRLHRRRNADRRRATQALKREERDRNAKKVVGGLSEAYALVRKTALALDSAVREASTKEARDHLSRALDRLYRCEDEISRAIRTAVESGAANSQEPSS